MSDDGDWIEVLPSGGASQGERDPVTAVFRTAGLEVGNYAAAITVASPVGTQRVAAVLAVLPPARYPLSVSGGSRLRRGRRRVSARADQRLFEGHPFRDACGDILLRPRVCVLVGLPCSERIPLRPLSWKGRPR